MSMFDTVKCDMSLPDGYQPESSFQTKDMGNEMAHYRITSQGRLVRETEGWFENEELDPPKDTNYHGMVRFYDLENSEEYPDDRSRCTWHEYDAKFTDGQCVDITQIPREEAG